VETAAFDYDLPSDRIAQHPVEPRDASRLLVDHGPGRPPEHRHVRDLPQLLERGDLLVLNETRVLPARLHLRKATGGAVEVLLLERLDDSAPAASAGWQALVRPSRKVAPGTLLVPAAADPGGAEAPDGGEGHAAIEVLDDAGEGKRRVRLLLPAAADRDDELAFIERLGEMPLPPYITAPLAEPERYQTVYSRRPASAAAPTAGLHFTTTLLEAVRASGVSIATVELVVGLDTFRPMATEHVEDHAMHSEVYRVPDETWAQVKATHEAGRSVVAVGTTAMRALESVAARGELAGRTDLFIRGDFPFAVVDRLLTNFHLPRSSLLVLVDAFIGSRWRDLYEDALASSYRFLSFGDAMRLTREPRP
jgi:S-adenosylmethionine:tRNA ribosyltransferase-isomerase